MTTTMEAPSRSEVNTAPDLSLFTFSPNISDFAAAFVKAQPKFEKATRHLTAKIKSQKANYDYDYADLEEIVDACRPALAEHGLGFLQNPRTTPRGVSVQTIIIHESGQWVGGELELSADKLPQSTGSAITYARRYALGAMLGIVTTDDDDGAAAQRSVQRQQQQKPRDDRGRADARLEQTRRIIADMLEPWAAAMGCEADKGLLWKWVQSTAKVREIEEITEQHLKILWDGIETLKQPSAGQPAGNVDDAGKARARKLCEAWAAKVWRDPAQKDTKLAFLAFARAACCDPQLTLEYLTGRCDKEAEAIQKAIDSMDSVRAELKDFDERFPPPDRDAVYLRHTDEYVDKLWIFHSENGGDWGCVDPRVAEIAMGACGSGKAFEIAQRHDGAGMRMEAIRAL